MDMFAFFKEMAEHIFMILVSNESYVYNFLHRKSKNLKNIEKNIKKAIKMIINDPCDLSRTDEKIFVVGSGLIGL